jgi:hypothetical protein
MKTLVDVEPRTAIRAADAPIVISQPGSYYLAEDLVAAGLGDDAITIAASGVTLDLNGFSIRGSEVGVWTRGITVTGTPTSIAIVNGTVRDCSSDGVALDPNSAADEATNCHVEGVRSLSNGAAGFRIGPNSLIIDSTASGNGQDGIYLSGSRAERCIVRSNGNNGIVAVARSTVEGCTARENGATGIFAALSTVRGCSVYNNQDGIRVGSAKSSIIGNEAHYNTAHGIIVQAGTTQNVRVEGNDSTSNGADGIRVDGTGHIVIRNVASDNDGSNYSILAGNTVGPILNVSGSTISSSNPWANFQY